MAVIPAGYKQTEVGVIPEDWVVKTLGEDCQLITKGTTPTSIGRNFTKSGINFLKAESISEVGKIIPDKVTFIDDETHAMLKRSQVVSGDLLVSIAGVLGRVGDVGDADIPANTNQALAIVRLAQHSALERSFLFFCLRSQVVERQIRDINVQAAQANISLQNVRDFRLPAPTSNTEQRAIAAALSDVEALLTKLDQLIGKKRDLKQAAMQQLLTGQTRLPEFDKNRKYKQTQVGVIPEDWDASTIGCDIDLLTGFPFPSSGYSHSGVRLLRGSNVKRGETDWTEEITQYWPAITHDIARYELREGDLVIAMDGSLVGRSSAKLAECDLPALLLQRVARIRSTKKLDSGYLAAFVDSDWFVKHADSVKTVTAIPHISPADICSFTIPIPPSLKEQTAIASVLSDMDAEIAALEARRDKTRALKQGMMQELLTGRIRLV